ncbi:hypothetical protein PPACK8108_LOCUS16801 [Phakopsora pachyrhizi]|uniref:Uncharacterized protein n=1 Tax=Phakopsora pachyrhizi TaxID=170000 RepID=A0AAV0BAN0_PHAPC|nr:hypothetical protein PPACK8108_LOCUS16801 [Phakopsora pachyrhizi]
MHPLMLYSLTCTAAACALALLMDFFIAEFKKVVKLLSLGKLTVSSSLARKSATLLEALMQKIEEHSREHNMAFDRAKKGSVAHTRTRGDELFESSEEPRRKVPAHSFNVSYNFIQIWLANSYTLTKFSSPPLVLRFCIFRVKILRRKNSLRKVVITYKRLFAQTKKGLTLAILWHLCLVGLISFHRLPIRPPQIKL